MLSLFLATALSIQQPFESAALSWHAASPVAARVRVSADGKQWSEWIPLAIDDDSSDPSAGRWVTAIARFGSAQRYIEYAFDGAVERVDVVAFPPAPPDLRRIARDSCPFGALTIRARTDWGCPDGENAPLWTPQHTVVTHAVVHHTAGANNVANWDAELRNIWSLHTYTNQWGDIGYNFLIDPTGTIYEGRAGGEGIIGAHFSCRNSNTVGIALLGTFTSVPPTDAALASLERLLTELSRRDGIDPMATRLHPSSGLNLPTILGHRDGNVPGATCTITECPGDVLYSMLPAIRADVKAALDAPPPPRRRAVRP
jgi:hypothetical protein